MSNLPIDNDHSSFKNQQLCTTELGKRQDVQEGGKYWEIKHNYILHIFKYICWDIDSHFSLASQ